MRKAQNSYLSLNTLKMYLGLDGEDYWHIDYLEYDHPYDGRSYFWDLSQKAALCTGPFDENGILEFVDADNNKCKHVINICHYAIGAYEMFLKSNDEKYRIAFLNHAKWLCDNQEGYHGISGVWILKYPAYLYGLERNSVSAMAQGMGISTLTRAYLLTEDKKFILSAKEAVNIFSVDVLKGGISRQISDNFLCFEEYSTLDSPSCVLNGFISAILGLYDLLEIDDYSFARELYENGLSSLSENISRWDCKIWSLYDLYISNTNNYSSYFYHKYHIKQLRALYRITGKEVFLDYSKKWNKYINNPIYKFIAFLKKVLYRLNRRLL